MQIESHKPSLYSFVSNDNNNNSYTSNRENIKVVIRIRPLIGKENENVKSISFQNNKLNMIGLNKSFVYDYIADENIGQTEMFNYTTSEIAESTLNGYNGTIFVYGQTGAGKTYTLLGKNPDSKISENSGILPRSISFLFDKINKDYKSSIFSIKCTFLEIYNEALYDLLGNYNDINKSLVNNKKNNIIIRDQGSSVKIENLSEHKISNLKEALDIINIGIKNRATAPTLCNKESSRSHAVFSIYIENKLKINNKKITKKSVFNLIDLAGSEKQKFTSTVGERTKEAGNINKSLMNLGHVIKSLVDKSENNKKSHIHYRDSKLTHILKDSLGGNSKTCIIANISASVNSSSETLSTLQFAHNAKQIKNKVVVNEEVYSDNYYKEEIKKLADQYDKIKQENAFLQNLIKDGNVNGINLNSIISNNSLNETNINCNNSLEVLTKQLTIYEEEACQKDNKIVELVQENSFLREKIEQLDVDIKLKTIEKNEEEEKLINSYKEINILRDDLKNNTYENIKNNAKIEDLNQTINEKENKYNLKIKSMEDNIASINNTLKYKEEQLFSIKDKLKLSEEENRKLESKFLILQDKLLKNEISLNELEMKIKQKDIEAVKLEDQIRHIEDDKLKEISNNNKLKQELNEKLLIKQQEINDLLSISENLKLQVLNNDNNINKLKKSYNKNINSCLQLSKTREEAENKLHKSNISIIEKDRKIDLLRSEIVVLKEKQNDLENALNNVNKEYSSFIENKSNANKVSTVLNQKNQINELQKEISLKTKQILGMENFIKSFNISNKLNKSTSAAEIIVEIDKKSNELNILKGIIHNLILRIKNIIDVNKEGFTLSEIAIENIENKAMEEKFNFYIEELFNYNMYLEKRIDSFNSEVNDKTLIYNDLKNQLHRQSLLLSDNINENNESNDSSKANDYSTNINLEDVNNIKTSKVKCEKNGIDESDNTLDKNSSHYQNALDYANGKNNNISKSKIISKIRDTELVNIVSVCESISKLGSKRQLSDKENNHINSVFESLKKKQKILNNRKDCTNSSMIKNIIIDKNSKN